MDMDFIDFSGGYPEAAEDLGESNAQQAQQFSQAVSAPSQGQTTTAIYHSNVPQQVNCDIKPRLTKEQHDILESHYLKQSKPNTNTKKGFAESLSVSLDKVNNWFQNRRAKSKQDAKKHAGALNLYQSQNFGSDSESSPFQTSPQYQAMMQHWSTEEQAPNGLGISQIQQVQDEAQFQDLHFGNDMATSHQFQNFTWPQQPQHDVYDSALDFNRRTLTQEHYDAMVRDGGMINSSGQFETLHASFQGDQGALNQVFNIQPKQETANFPYPVGAPIPFDDSTVPSNNMSTQSFEMFPSSNIMQNHTGMSTTSSDWTDSRTSSLSTTHFENNAAHFPGQQQPPPATTSQWEPGKSVPVDVNVMKGEFDQVAQANQVRASLEQHQAFEQPLAWPADGAFLRRDSSASMLAHSMSSVGINTPQPQHAGVFKSPAPLSNIAARRQRPRPAALGLASLRSQSIGGPVQPASPGQGQQPPPMSQGHPIRRVMSTNVLNGGVAQGRIMKSMPGSAQRSPLNWNFNDAINSPQLVRNVSHGSLAPPTPMSPSVPEQYRQQGTWQTPSGQGVRQPSISETDEYGLPYYPSSSVPPPHVSPPHTPMWQQQFIPQRIGSTVITENTPPQSAPAGQSCFPTSVFAAPKQHVQQQPQLTQAPVPHQMHTATIPPQQPFVASMAPEQSYHMPNVTFAPNQQANVVSSGPAPGVPLHFANGVPVVTADGNIQMAFPTQAQLMQQPPHPTPSPPQMAYAFVTSAGGSPGMQATAQPLMQASQQASDFVVHEYTPPDSLKRSATPRKPVDTGPKNYTFSNAGPEQYARERLKRGDRQDSTTSTSSPASSIGAIST